MESPPPPSQRQAEEAQRARFAAETAILSLFRSVGTGAGGGENEPSILRSMRIAAILSALSAAIVVVSFRHPQDRTRSLLLAQPDHKQVSERLLFDAQSDFNRLVASDLTDEQKAVLWATWAHSRVSDEVARAVDSGELPHEFSDNNLRLKKIWISRSDGRVRPLHVKLHGRAVLAEGDFWRWPDTGHRLRWPGDREAPPEATIGCRCVCLLSWANQGSVSETIQRIKESTEPR